MNLSQKGARSTKKISAPIAGMRKFIFIQNLKLFIIYKLNYLYRQVYVGN